MVEHGLSSRKQTFSLLTLRANCMYISFLPWQQGAEAPTPLQAATAALALARSYAAARASTAPQQSQSQTPSLCSTSVVSQRQGRFGRASTAVPCDRSSMVPAAVYQNDHSSVVSGESADCCSSVTDSLQQQQQAHYNAAARLRRRSVNLLQQRISNGSGAHRRSLQAVRFARTYY